MTRLAIKTDDDGIHTKVFVGDEEIQNISALDVRFRPYSEVGLITMSLLMIDTPLEFDAELKTIIVGEDRYERVRRDG
jgi:hypothetical protein